MTTLLQPAPPLTTRGSAELTFTRVGQKTAITRALASSPLRLLTPTPRTHAAWAFTSSYGGGLVSGDRINMKICVEKNASAYLSTQSATKVYPAVGEQGSSQSLDATLADDSLLVLTPDPLVCFARARYTQTQKFHLAPTANLVLLDWFTSGRQARGERWQFSHFESRNEIFVNDAPKVVDALLLNLTQGSLAGPLSLTCYHVFATLILTGPRLKSESEQLLHAISALPVTRRPSLLAAASPLDNGLILRLAAEKTEDAAWFLYTHLAFLTDLLGEHPWQRKW